MFKVCTDFKIVLVLLYVLEVCVYVYKEVILPNLDSCTYPTVKCSYYPDTVQLLSPQKKGVFIFWPQSCYSRCSLPCS